MQKQVHLSFPFLDFCEEREEMPVHFSTVETGPYAPSPLRRFQVQKSHFVEKEVATLKNWQHKPGNGNTKEYSAPKD
jgi:hypothetical protein